MMTPEERQHNQEHWQETRRVIMQLFGDLDEKDEEIAILRQRTERAEDCLETLVRAWTGHKGDDYIKAFNIINNRTKL